MPLRVRRHMALVLLCVLVIPLGARAAESCAPHVMRAEAWYQIPQGLLQAMALVESGLDGAPQPYALNVGGKAVYARSAAEAWAHMHQGGQLRRDVDVGCLQISVRYHGAQVGRVSRLLDPGFNASYAAGFLRSLKEREGSWSKAVAAYHSGRRRNQIIYVCKVWRALVSLGGPAVASEPAACRAEAAVRLADAR